MRVARARWSVPVAVAVLGTALRVAGPAAATATTDATSTTTRAAAHDPVTTWAASADDLGPAYTDKTIRDIVHTSIGGTATRLRLSNAFGTGAVTFDDVYVGEQAAGAAVVQGSNRRVTFGGRRTITVPKGAEVLSDPVDMTVRPRTNLSVSIHVDGPTGEVTGHHLATQTVYYSDGDDAADIAAAPYVHQIESWFWLDAVTVRPATAATTVVPFGDSITDGYQSTVNANHRWPDYLADRLAGRHGPGYGIANEGISGNKITVDGAGVSAQARLDRDVLSQAGARTVILLEGINDIGGGDVTTVNQLIQADRQLIARTHAAGKRILGATLTPYQGAFYYSARGERIREALNAWIRSGGEFDGVVDFDLATRDPAHPKRFLPRYDSGDHLHPSDTGYAAMADAVPLRLL